jgi:hypothetical protein
MPADRSVAQDVIAEVALLFKVGSVNGSRDAVGRGAGRFARPRAGLRNGCRGPADRQADGGDE